MGIGRLLTILLIAWLLYALYKRFIKNKFQAGKNEQNRGPKEIEKIVKCEKCSIHIPIEEAIKHKGRYYCSKAHLQADDET